MKTRLGLTCSAAVLSLRRPNSGPGFALRFNDSASDVAVPQAVGLNSFPVKAWVNTTAAAGQRGLVSKHLTGSLNGWNLFLLNGRVASRGVYRRWQRREALRGRRAQGFGAWTGTSGPPSTSQAMRFGSYPGGIRSFNGACHSTKISVWIAALSQSQARTPDPLAKHLLLMLQDR